MRIHAGVVTLLAIGALSGCGGGGGGGAGGGTGGVRPTPGTPVFVAGETSETEALSQSVATTPPRPPSNTDGTVTLTLDAAGNPESLAVTNPTTPSVGGTWSGDEIACSGTSCRLDDGDIGALANPTALGWSYQTFGYWVDDPTSSGRHTAVFSTGSPTPANAVLGFATATYTGHSGGLYVNGDVVSEHRADMTADVDFGSRSIDFRTTNTQMGALGGTSMAPAAHLDMTGTLNITSGFQFSGEVNTANSIEGTATGRFYGPNAEEIGGVFLCNCTSPTEYLTGAFGGKR